MIVVGTPWLGPPWPIGSISVIRGHFDIIQQNAAFAGNGLAFGHQPAILVFAPDPKDPFLFGFFPFDQPDHPTDDHCQEYHHFVFNAFHGSFF
jgi:hypothetical protein